MTPPSQNRHALLGARVFTGEEILSGRAVVLGADGRIEAIPEASDLPAGVARSDLAGGLVAPGFIDWQVNGGGGVLFNHAPTPEAIGTILAAHRRFGTTGALVTLISDTAAVMQAARRAVAAGLAQGLPGLLGIHFEGPWLSADKPGVHRPDRLRDPDPADWAAIRGPDAGAGPQGITLVTLAPERAGLDAIEDLTRAGMVVSLGHSMADFATAMAAFGAGAKAVTHLHNAMAPLASREPGMIGAALSHGGVSPGLIADLHHVHPATLKLSIAAVAGAGGSGRACLVTDAMPPVGTDLTEFDLQGRRVTVLDGRCICDGSLAGSALDMAQAVRNAVTRVGVPLPEALRMASAYPAKLLGLAHRKGRIAPGFDGDLVHLDDGLAARATWIGGVRAPATGM